MSDSNADSTQVRTGHELTLSIPSRALFDSLPQLKLQRISAPLRFGQESAPSRSRFGGFHFDPHRTRSSPRPAPSAQTSAPF